MNFSKNDIEMIKYLADERKLEINVYYKDGKRSVELHENTCYSLEDKFYFILAENVKTLKAAKEIVNKFNEWLDQFGNINYGYNIKADYVTL